MNMAIFIPLVVGLQLFYWLVGRSSSKSIKTRLATYSPSRVD